MNLNVLTVTYSIFGSYDFVDNTPENVSKLYEEFNQDGFMPNMVTLLKIEQPQNKVMQLLRPQLVNQVMPCTITILPERVDVETGINVKLDNIITFFDRILQMFELKINRIAVNKSTIIDELTKEEAAKLKDKLTPPETYKGEHNLIEYASHRVARKRVDSLGELINVGRNVTGISTANAGEINRVQVDTDINTLGENTKERFEIEDCRSFFEDALRSDQEILENMVGISNAE